MYLAPTGEEREDLIEAVYSQDGARFAGTELSLDFSAHPNLWITSGVDYVNAKLTASDTPLPRIPPLRGRFGVDFRYKGLSVKPELTMANAQETNFSNRNQDGWVYGDRPYCVIHTSDTTFFSSFCDEFV